MDYETPGCAYCPPTVRACRQGESESRGPGFCPSKVDGEGIAEADAADRLFGVTYRPRAVTNQIQSLKERLKDELYRFIEFNKAQCDKHGVEFHVGEEVTAEIIRAGEALTLKLKLGTPKK